MKNSLYLGKLAGIKMYVHWTFPLIIVWIVFVNLSKGFNAVQILWSVAFVIAIFLCVVLHEMGHVLAARRYKIDTKNITLLPIGGVSNMEKIPSDPKEELVVTLAGPAVNVAIVIILFIFLSITNGPTDFSRISYVNGDNFLLSLAAVNLWLAIFNLIPAFPMDGGRILRALLSLFLNRSRATKIAAQIAQVIAFLFIIAGFFVNPFLIFIGLFVIFGAMAETQQVQNQSVLENHTVEEVTMKKIPALNRNDTIDKAVELLLQGQAKNFLVMDDGKPFGTLNRDGIIKSLQSNGKDMPVEVATDRNVGNIEATEPLEKALSLMQEQKYPLLVVTKNNQLYGITDMENILEFIMVLNAKKSSSG